MTRAYMEGTHYAVMPTGCWEWLLARDPSGYGHTVLGSRTTNDRRWTPAHRAVWASLRGPIPEGLQIDHLCRNPACVNPDHLEPVSPAENVRRGKRTKLTWEDVRTIRACGGSSREVAPRFGVSHVHIAAIRRRATWWPEP